MTLRRLLTRSLVLLAAGCGGSGLRASADPRAILDSVPKTDVERLAKKRIYFGHQSIGYNIVDGLMALEKQRPDLGLAVKETKDPTQLAGGVFAHSRVGENKAPLSKIQDFARTLESGVGRQTDIAFFKFCYVDFQADTDAEKVFAEYKSTMARLRQQFPELTIVHVTTPLSVVQTGPKATLKRIIGKKRWGADENIVRDRYNDLLRREYQGKEPVFDLAAIEATRQDGGTATFEENSAAHPMLAVEYASDGKHLNELGGRWVAAHLVKQLASLPR